MEIRPANVAEDVVLARHYLELWESYGTPPGQYEPDAEAAVLRFIRDGRQGKDLGVFLALIDGKIAGSIACQLHVSPYPEVILPALRKQGYIWSVFVAAEHRRKGVARRLVERALQYLREIGCTGAVLHSSDAGEALYGQIGFTIAKEMRMPL